MATYWLWQHISYGNAEQGLRTMGKLLAGTRAVSAVIGPGCSSACKVTSYLSGGQDIPQISWGCASPKLSDKSQHRLVRIALPVPHYLFRLPRAVVLNWCSSLEHWRRFQAQVRR